MLKKPWLYLPFKFFVFYSPSGSLFLYNNQIRQASFLAIFGLERASLSKPTWHSGGLDKNACHIKNYWSLGAGFLEIGTVTPESQSPQQR